MGNSNLTPEQKEIRAFTSSVHNMSDFDLIQIKYTLKQSMNRGIGVFVNEDILSGSNFILIEENESYIDKETLEYLEYKNFITGKNQLLEEGSIQKANSMSKIMVTKKNQILSLVENTGKFINDLAYHDGEYNIDLIRDHTNIMCIRVDDFIFGNRLICFRALKDIKVGEELSRVYGIDFWKDYEFWQKRPDCKWKETGLYQDLPDEYIFIDNIRPLKMMNTNYELYGKKVGDKYYYKSYYNTFNSESKETAKHAVDLSLPNNEIRQFDDYFSNEHCEGQRDDYWKTQPN